MAYELEDFCRDCEQVLAPAQAPGQGLERVRDGLERLLANAAFTTRVLGADASPGVHRLHSGRCGFQVLAHVLDEARASPPHDHGASWAVYGQAAGHTDMTLYRKVGWSSSPGFERLEASERYRLEPGRVGIYPPGVIHSIDCCAGSRFIRVTGADLDRIERQVFDLRTGEIHRANPRPAT